MNKSILAKSEVCQVCGRCCKEFNFIEYNRDWALRWKLLNSPKIVVEDVKTDGRIIWRVRFRIQCSKLRYKAGKYHCDIHDGDRPGFCETYPDNLTLEQWKFEDNCPIIVEMREKLNKMRGKSE